MEFIVVEFDKVYKDMIFFVIFGIKDFLRFIVKKVIEDCKCVYVKVCMVIGDNLFIGCVIVKECGIYNFEEGGIVMEGFVFCCKIFEELKEFVFKFEVFVCFSFEDKCILVKMLKDFGEMVVVIGDGINDVLVFKMVDIGFVMGIVGIEVVKEVVVIIFMDDNFVFIVKGISWGCVVNDVVKKFLQVCMFF